MLSVKVNLLIIFALIVLFSFVNIKRDKYILSLGMVFNAYAFLYLFIGLIFYEVLINNWYYNFDLLLISSLCIVAIISFNSFYFLSPSILNLKRTYVPSRQMVIFVCIVGVAVQLLLILKVGPTKFFTMDRVERFAIFNENKVFLLVSSAMYIGFVMSAVRFLILRTNKDKLLFSIIMWFILIYSVSTISRTHLTIVIITIVFVYERTEALSKKQIVISMSTIAILMLFFKGFLYGVFFEEKNYASFNPGEFINWIRNTTMVFNTIDNENGSGFQSYLLTFQSMFVVNPDGEPLSHWFINEFYPDKVSSGLTYGFSGIAEGYLASGYLGVAMHFGLLGLILGYISKSKNFMSFVISLFIMFLLFRVFRSESYNFVRTLTWYYLYPLFIIVLADKIFKRI